MDGSNQKISTVESILFVMFAGFTDVTEWILLALVVTAPLAPLPGLFYSGSVHFWLSMKGIKKGRVTNWATSMVPVKILAAPIMIIMINSPQASKLSKAIPGKPGKVLK